MTNDFILSLGKLVGIEGREIAARMIVPFQYFAMNLFNQLFNNIRWCIGGGINYELRFAAHYLIPVF